ncbi:hypothetical protein [Streptomyces griseus]|uniref:hypothetical protein n=1 Tax=Streptomyces griseus TaxID=1911 RepID=UPI003439B0F1
MLPLISSHAQVYDREFRRRGVREQGWGRGMVAVAVLIWLWLAYQLFFSFTIEYGVRSETVACDSRAFHRDASSDEASHSETERRLCAAERDWGPMLAAFLLSLPLATAGAALYASGTSALRTAEYAAQVTRLNAVEEP